MWPKDKEKIELIELDPETTQMLVLSDKYSKVAIVSVIVALNIFAIPFSPFSPSSIPIMCMFHLL